MSGQTLHAEVTEQGTAVIASDEVASLGARPGDRLRLRLVSERQRPARRPQRETLRGALQLARRVPASAFEEASRQAAADAEASAWPS